MNTAQSAWVYRFLWHTRSDLNKNSNEKETKKEPWTIIDEIYEETKDRHHLPDGIWGHPDFCGPDEDDNSNRPAFDMGGSSW